MSVNTKKNKAGSEKSHIKDALSDYRKKLALMNIELGIYREIGDLTVKGSNRNSILKRLMDFALKALETDSGALYILDSGSGELIFEIITGSAAKKLKGLRMRSDTGIAGRVAKTGKPYICDDLSKDSVWLGIKAGSNQRNMMAVPLMVNGGTIGVLEVINKAGGKTFTKDDLKVLTSLANHFSIIMERANLFSDLDDSVKQLSTLYEVGNLLISTLDQKVVRHRAMEAITKLMRAETGSLLLVDSEANELYFEVALGAKGKKLKEVRLVIGEGIAGWVAKHGKSLIIHDVDKDRRFQSSFDKKSKFRTRNMVCVPVRIKGKVIGVLQAINRIGGVFTDEDLKLFELFSNQVAIALDNARLYEEIKETFYATAESLAESIEKRDPYTGGHTKRVLEYSLAIAKRLELTPESIETIKLSAVLHDIGKIGIEDSILKKDAPLTGEEAALMRKHPQFGAEIMEHVPQLKDIVPGMLYHHERIDGKGYPNGFKGEEIPLNARIIAVADTYDAMTTTRPYRKGLPAKMALDEIKRCSGFQFDGRIVEAFIEAAENGEIKGLRKSSGLKKPKKM